VEFSISILKDAGEGVVKVVEALDKLIDFIANAAGRGTDAIKWNKDRRLYDHLTDLHAKTVIFAQTWCRQTEDSLAEYITDPEPEDWPKLQRVFHGVLAEVGFIISQLESEAKRLATFQFYEELLRTFVERERALRKILELPPPISIEDIRELK
jgi:hypothetical protein